METTSLKGVIPQSPIKSQTIHFLYGKLATNKNIFDTMSSLEIVQSAFGVESTNPSAVDVTEAIVKNLDSAEQIKLRTKINDPMEVGELWHFTTPKMFMILLSKVPLGNNTHELTLTLITKFEGSTDTGTEICSRHLASIGSGNVRFMSPRLRHIEFNASSVEFLQKIHDEAVANLKTNIEKSESEPETTTPSAPVTGKSHDFSFDKGDMISICCLVDKGYASIANLTKTELVVVHAPNFESKYKLGTYVALCDQDNIKLVDGDISTIDSLMACLSPIVLKSGAVVIFEQGKEPNEVNIRRCVPDGYTDDTNPGVEFNRTLKYQHIDSTFKYGFYVLNTNLCERDLEYVEIDALIRNFTIIQFPPMTEKDVETVNQIAKEIIEDQDPIVISEGEIVVFKKCDVDDMVVVCRYNEQNEAIATMYDPGHNILINNGMLGENKSVRNIRKSELATRELDEIWDCFNHIDNSSDAYTEEVPASEKFTPISVNCRTIVSIAADNDDGRYIWIIPSGQGTWHHVRVQDFTTKYKFGKYVSHNCYIDVKIDDDGNGIDELMKHLSPLALERGAIVFFEKGKEPNEVLITRRAPEGYSDQLGPDVKFERGFIDPNVGPDFKYGYYFLNTNLCEQDFQFSEIDDFMSLFSPVQGPAIPEPDTQSDTVKTTEEKETTEMPTDIQIKIDPGFVDIEENLCQMIKEYVTENPGASDDQVTTHVRSCTEIDEIKVQCVDGVWTVAHEPVETKEEQETVSTVDIRDVNIQNSLLRGLFGVADPAITHVQKFLRNHLTSEGNAGFLATGSFPTETVIVYTEKPYDLTIAIVRFKDGRFYRIFGCQTALGLTDHGYIATKDMPGRWVKFGRDIQDVSYRGEQRRRY